MFNKSLQTFASTAFLYKQVFWGGLWAFLMLLPIMPKNWIVRGVIIGLLPALAVLLYFFPSATVDGQGPGMLGLNIGILTPLYVIFANQIYGLVTSKAFALVEKS